MFLGNIKVSAQKSIIHFSRSSGLLFSASWKAITTVLFYFCSTELSCFLIHAVK